MNLTKANDDILLNKSNEPIALNKTIEDKKNKATKKEKVRGFGISDSKGD